VLTLVTAHDIHYPQGCAHFSDCVRYPQMCTLHHFTVQYMRAPCHERCITKMMSKHLTILNILGLDFHLGLAEGYYNPLPLFMHYPQCIKYPYTTKFSKFFKKMWVFYPHCILMLPSSVFGSIPGPSNLYNPYGLIPKLFDFLVQNAHRMHLETAFLLHLNNIPINNMISIRYVFL
jgi:hypothetical protein